MQSQVKKIGYHGTLTEIANTILKDGYSYNESDNHWLGQGIYFYTEKDLAKWFATRKYNKNSKNQITVLKSTLITTSNKFINLDSNNDVDFVLEKIKELWEELKTITFDAEDEIKNRCIILDVIKEYYGIDIIIKTFQTKKQSYGGANIEWFEKNYFPLGISYNETQICVTSNNSINHSVDIGSSKHYKYPKKIRFE